PLSVTFYISPTARARKVSITLDGHEVASQTYDSPGAYTLKSGPVIGSVVTIEVDQTFTAPPDRRELGIILLGVGFGRGGFPRRSACGRNEVVEHPGPRPIPCFRKMCYVSNASSGGRMYRAAAEHNRICLPARPARAVRHRYLCLATLFLFAAHFPAADAPRA